MHHAMLDKFAGRDTPVHRLDPAAKTVAALAVVLATVTVTRGRFAPLVPVAAALAVYHALARLPVLYVAKRLLIVSPFALGVVLVLVFATPGTPAATLETPWGTLGASGAGLAAAGSVLARFFLAAWAMLLLLGSTRFQDVLRGLERLRVPRAFVVQLAFLYRYLWLLVDERHRMGHAREARDGGAGPWRVRMAGRTGLVGVLFLRTWQRAERIYWAMAARGFDGTLHRGAHEPLRAADWLFIAGSLAGAAGVVVFDRVTYG